MKKLANLNGVKILSKIRQKVIFGGGDPIPTGPGGGSGGNGTGGNGTWPTNVNDCLLCGGEWELVCALPDDSPCL